VWVLNLIWFDEDKDFHMSSKALNMWDLNFIWFDEDKDYSHELESFKRVRF